MNQVIDTKPFSAKKAFIGLTLLALFSFTNCKNKEQKAPETATATAQTASQPQTSSADYGTHAEQLKTAQAPQSPLHKLLDSLNVAGQPQWKLRYLDSVATKNKNITIPQLRLVFDSLGRVKRGFIKK